MMKKLIISFSAVFTLTLPAMARQVSGEVVSAENGDPLIGATVMAVGTHIGTATDIDGKFTLDVPDNVKKIRVSYVGNAVHAV